MRIIFALAILLGVMAPLGPVGAASAAEIREASGGGESASAGGLSKTQVSRLYVAIFGRASEGRGNAYWREDPRSTSMAAAADIMMNTESARAYFGAALNENRSFIAHIYKNTLGKGIAEDPAGIAYWAGELDGGKGRGAVVAALIDAALAPENAGAAQNRFRNRVAVSDYCADQLRDYTDRDTFSGFIDGVDEREASMAAAKALILETAGRRTFAVTFGSWRAAHAARQTGDGGYIVAGSRIGGKISEPSGKERPYGALLKSDARGEEVWSVVLEEGPGSALRAVSQTADGGYVAAGYQENSSGDYDLLMVRLDGDGNRVWARTFDNGGFDLASSVELAPDGGFVAVGSSGTGDRKIHLLKIDGDGNLAWKRSFGGAGSSFAEAVRKTSDGGYVIVGTTDSYGAGASDIYLVKTDGAGNESWHRTFGGEDLETGVDVRQTSDGGYVIAGNVAFLSEGQGSGGVLLIKADADGDEVWSATFGEGAMAHGVVQAPDGGYVVAGGMPIRSEGSKRVSGVYLFKADAEGRESWSRSYGGCYDGTGDYALGQADEACSEGADINQTGAFSIALTDDGGYVVAGTTALLVAGNGDNTLWRQNDFLVKTDGNGEFRDQ